MTIAPGAPYLEWRGLRKTVNRRPLFAVERLGLQTGRCLLLSGANGVGKTTLLKIIAGLETPDAGEVYREGQRLTLRDARRVCRRDVIYLHQQPYLFDATVADNVAYGLRGTGRTRAEIAWLVDQALAAVDIAPLARRSAHELSGGEKQRVALARALVLSPRLLLLDEPLANLDEESRARAYFLIQRLRADRIGVVITAHELHRLANLCDLHLKLEGGALRVVGERDDESSARVQPLRAAIEREMK